MKNLITIATFIGSVLTSQLLPLTTQFFTSRLGDSAPLDNKRIVENCDYDGRLFAFSIENCTDTEGICNIVTKREYNVNITFEASVTTSNLIWRVIININGQDQVLVERPIYENVQTGVTYTLFNTFAFGFENEGLSLPATFQIIDASTQRAQICHSAVLDINSWHMVPEILSRIKAPTFPDRDFDITSYGAVPDGVTDNTEAFSRAIVHCHLLGGGRVVVPPGVFLSSAITLLSNVNLHLKEGSTILFTQNTTAYPNVFTRLGGLELINFSPFIYAFGAENIALTGSGVLNGNADCEHWWPWKGSNHNLELLCGIIEGFPTEEADVAALTEMAERNVPVEERIFGEGHFMRPVFVQPYNSKNILIEGVTFLRSPNWILNPVLCENVIVRDVTINSTGPNSDGCNPESSKDVLIENVRFITGDDCIAVKSGRNADGRRINVKSENIVIQNCEMENGHGGFTIGSEISGGAQNIFCQNCSMNSPQLEQGLRFKNNAVRGGLIEDIYIRNIHIPELYTGTSASRGMVLSIDFFYEEGPNGNYPPVVRNIDVRNVTAFKSNYALYLRGFPTDQITNVRLYDCHFDGVVRGSVIEHVEDLGLFNVTVNGDVIEVPAA
ncbi:hypothetical protein HA402_005979 [Bradysia odoriphaga]|nr:hypothetical protein HA402_005979 [Bradysia odoriphaga]